MEKITYKKLKEGYILKKGDVIDTIHGFNDLEAACCDGRPIVINLTVYID